MEKLGGKMQEEGKREREGKRQKVSCLAFPPPESLSPFNFRCLLFLFSNKDS
jgi:hypothetical protein